MVLNQKRMKKTENIGNIKNPENIKGEIDIKNKTPKKTQNIANSENISKTPEPQGDIVFALDIGTRTVVGAIGRQEENESGVSTFILIDYVVEPHPKRAMIDGQIEDIRQVSKIVNRVKTQLEERSNIKLERVSIAAAGRALKTKRVSEEFDVSTEMERGISADSVRSMEVETIQKAAQELSEERGTNTPYHCVGYSIISYALDDYKIISLESHRGEKASIELIATFLPNVVVEGLYSVMDMCSLEVSSLTLEPIAAMNAIIPKEVRLINIALVDIGAGTSDIAISKDGSIVAYAMATIAGDETTEEIIKTYFVDFDTAEAIKQTCCNGEEYTYRDIFGMERVITPDEFTGKIKSSVDALAETVRENILNANDGPPSAVFLIGGGSLIKGLTKAVSDSLGIPIERVALGSHENLRGIDTGGKVMGAEFVTVLGIALTSTMSKGYDFSSVTLNDKPIRVFNTNKLTVFDLLSTAGYKAAEILGRSGHSLSFFINSVRKTVRGGGFKPAEVTMGGKTVSLNQRISGGDRVCFVPAECGENAVVTLREAVSPDGSPIPEDLGITVNDEEADNLDYIIQNLDRIETFVKGNEYTDIDDFNDNGEPLSKEPLTPDISVILNGEIIELPANEDGMTHIFLELFNFTNMDLKNAKTGYITLLNGSPAGFNDELKDGDEAVIKWRD